MFSSLRSLQKSKMFQSAEDRDYVYNDMLSVAMSKHQLTIFGTHQHILLKNKGPHQYRRIYRKCPSEAVYYMYSHQIVALKKCDMLQYPSDKHETSHLCHVKDCINPNHLVIEHGNINKQRTHCLDERILRHDPTYCSQDHDGPNCIPGN